MKKSHKGVILSRLKNERSQNKILVLEKVLNLFSNQLITNFTVVTEKNIRIIEQKV